VIYKCPGQDRRFISAEALKCAACGYEIEVFSDEIKIRCPRCRGLVYRETLPSCVDWCRYAKDCIGEQAYNNHLQNKAVTIKQKLIEELVRHFGKDAKRIAHAKKVMQFAEELLRRETADWHIVIPASILHDVGIKAAEEKYGSAAGHYQEKEGPEIARKILLKTGLKKEDIDEICGIVANHHSPGKINTQNFKVLYDADWLVNLKDEVVSKEKDKMKGVINKVFLTKTGREIAEKIYLK